MIGVKIQILLIWSFVAVICIVIFIQRAEINNKQTQLDNLKSEYSIISSQIELARDELDTVKSEENQILSARKRGWGYPNEKRYIAK
ncbi:MAG: hypothetical protein IKQ31_01125 [Clostridia bacterium]|nr:hypothetical protein [Clostridia bacterium]